MSSDVEAPCAAPTSLDVARDERDRGGGLAAGGGDPVGVEDDAAVSVGGAHGDEHELEAPCGLAGAFEVQRRVLLGAELAQALGDVLHRPSKLAVPELALRAAVGEAAAVILASQRVLPERALAEGYAFKHPELRAALRSILS